ncbi:MAG: PQQ-binding-like beta-propeller repeat protein [Pirellulales bacterium]|nr:PQQ-binding-like beta-propeller repeat protein [Pirellulales bacterium]
MTRLSCRLSTLGLVIALATTENIFAADSAAYWPRFHGPNGDNISTDTGLLKEWPKDGPKLLWTAKGIGFGFAGVTMADGQIHTAGNLDDKTVVTAIDQSGRILWQAPNGEAWKGDWAGTRGTPTLDGPRVYHESPVGQVTCLDAKTGRPLWTRNILDEFGSQNIQWALAESVLVDGNRLICCPGGPQTAVVALNKMTGETVWKSPSASGDLIGYATPTLAEFQGLRMIFTMTLKALIGVNADTGELLFRVEHPTRYDVNATKPLFHDGHVFVSSGYGTTGSALYKLDVRGKTASATKVWESRELDNHHGGVVLLNGYLYGAAHNFNSGRWICLDWKTGEMKYAERGVGKGALTCADGMLYTMSEKRDVGLVPATPAAHKVVSRFKLPSGGEGPTWAHPVVRGGRLFIRHGECLYCYDVLAE